MGYYKILSSWTKCRRNVTIKFSQLPSRFIQSLQHFPANFLANSFKFSKLFTWRWNKTSTQGNKPAGLPRINVKASLSNLSYSAPKPYYQCKYVSLYKGNELTIIGEAQKILFDWIDKAKIDNWRVRKLKLFIFFKSFIRLNRSCMFNWNCTFGKLFVKILTMISWLLSNYYDVILYYSLRYSSKSKICTCTGFFIEESLWQFIYCNF